MADDSNGNDNLQLDDQGRLDRDLSCISCQYNLRGADPQGRCPECGTAVGRSTVGHWLRLCDPDWLRGIWQGLNGLSVMLACATIIYLDLWLELHKSLIPVLTELGHIFGVLVIFIVGALAGIMGFWKATMPEPSKINRQATISARRSARWLLIMTVVSLLIYVLNTLVMLSAGIDDHTVYLDPKTMIAWILVPGLVGVLYLLWYAGGLAKRIPNPTLKWLTILLVLCLGISGASVHAYTYDWAKGSMPVYRLIDYLSPFEGFVTWIWLGKILQGLIFVADAMLIGLFIWYWRAFKKQAGLAKQTWAATPFTRKNQVSSNV